MNEEDLQKHEDNMSELGGREEFEEIEEREQIEELEKIEE